MNSHEAIFQKNREIKQNNTKAAKIKKYRTRKVSSMEHLLNLSNIFEIQGNHYHPKLVIPAYYWLSNFRR